MKRRLGLIRFFALASILMLVAGCGSQAEPKATTPPSDDGVVPHGVTQEGDLAALGTVRPAQVLQLSFFVAAPVRAVHVQPGAQVRENDLLAELDTTALELELQRAREEVVICQAQLDRLLDGPRAALVERAEAEHAREVAEAQVALQMARQRLQEAQGAAAAAAETARLNWEIAANALREAQDACSRVYWENETLRQRGIELSQARKDAEASAWRRVEDAEAAMEQARLAYEQATSSTTASLLKAEVDLAALQIEGLLAWENPYLDPVSSEEIVQARARLRQAEVAVAGLEWRLQNAALRAPFAGVISAVYVHPGEWAAAGAAVVEIVDTSRWYVETRNVSELTIGRVRVGQKAIVQVNAFRDSELRGEVAAISPIAVVQQGDTTYTLIIALEPTDLSLRPGMTARVEIDSSP